MGVMNRVTGRKGMHINPAHKGLYTKHAHSEGHSLGKQIHEDLKEGSHASGIQKKRANFARMARRHFKPL